MIKLKNSERHVVVGLVQMRMVRSPGENVEKAVRKIREAVKKGAQILLLPELFRTQYFPQSRSTEHFQLAETIPGPTTEVFQRLARELEVVIIVPVFESHGQHLYHNTAVVIDQDGQMKGIYRKMHIPDSPLFYERHYFTPGDLGFKCFETRFGKVGVLICWDQWFPEAARLVALSGADILFYPTAIGWVSKERKAERMRERTAWEMIQRAHAIANGMFVAVANRVGHEGELAFWGRSFVAGPLGELIAQASGSREEILIGRCDLSLISRVRQEWPFLLDRRIDVYQAMASNSGADGIQPQLKI